MDPEDTFAVSEVNSAYSDVRAVDPLDLSDGGTNAWKAAIDAYVVLVVVKNSENP